jgi:hypothetical protein
MYKFPKNFKCRAKLQTCFLTVQFIQNANRFHTLLEIFVMVEILESPHLQDYNALFAFFPEAIAVGA